PFPFSPLCLQTSNFKSWNLFGIYYDGKNCIRLGEKRTLYRISGLQTEIAMTQEKPVGKTKDSGWQFGLRKTFYKAQEYLWDIIFSDKGLKIWLGGLEEELEPKKSYKTKEGIEGYVRV